MARHLPSVKASLQKIDVRPSKQRGQNFVINTSVLEDILSFGRPDPTENLLEIGPGLGALTERLIGYPKFKVVEIEPKFCTELVKKFPGLRIINEDVRQYNFESEERYTVFGNLPYSFSTEIIFHLVANAKFVKRAVLLLQKEFAERLAASPGGRDYGVLSINAQIWADISLGPIISGDSFHPPTKVQSRLVELAFSGTPRFDVGDPKWFDRVLRAAFLQRRRKILNSLKASGKFNNGGLLEALSESKIEPSRRAETVSIQEFIVLAKNLEKVAEPS